ncbi:MAG: DUF1592 domain-containing protein [Verrucomicrobiota bacterium]
MRIKRPLKNEVGTSFSGFAAFFALLFGICIPAAAETPLNLRGQAIYQKQCAECHGKAGEGVEGLADDPLVGSRTIESLAGRIERTMPEDEPKLCVGEDAQAVADYIYHAFYSAEARAKLEGVRVELARLTEIQHQNSVADLIGSFRGGYGRILREERGLKGFYNGDIRERAGQPAKKGDRFDRVDKIVKFDYGEGIPSFEESKNFDPINFTIHWSGSIWAEETGVYEFVIRTRNGAQLWVNKTNPNSRETPALIDGWVAPHNDMRDMTSKIFLVGGRAYPIKLEYFKYKEKNAAIELLWKPPHGVLEHIPTRVTRPDAAAESFIASTKFPPDDRSVGYERGTAVSSEWFEAATAAALEAAEYVVEEIDALARTNDRDQNREQKIREFAKQFADRGFRRPLSKEERDRIVWSRLENSETLEIGIKRLVLFVLTSPEFLYPGLQRDQPGNWKTASALALALWDSVPDYRRWNEQQVGKLNSEQQIRMEANRMLQDPRTKEKMRGFFRHWLELERSDDIVKDESVFPDFDSALHADLRTSLWMFLDGVVWSEKSDYRQLLKADYVYLNERLAKVYGPKNAKIQGGEFQRVTFDPKQRSGVITHPFLLTNFAYHNNTSPIHRGVFLTRNIVGMTLKSPPEANLFEDSKFDPNLTMREKVTSLTKSDNCMACHITINPLGFSLENFDGIGRWRTMDHNNEPINSRSDFSTDSGETLKLTGARDVTQFAATRPSAHQTFIEQLFHHIVKQPAIAYGPDTISNLRDDFEKSGFNIQKLIVEIAVIAASQTEST